MVDRYAKPLLHPDVVVREEADDWAVLYDPNTGEAYGLDPVGVFISKRLNGRKSIAEIVEELGEAFEGIPDGARDDAVEFVESLLERGLARV